MRRTPISQSRAVRLVALRGSVSTFDLLDDETRAQWADDIKGADVAVLDCLRPILDALGLDENREAGRLPRSTRCSRRAGVRDALLVRHMGHSGERARRFASARLGRRAVDRSQERPRSGPGPTPWPETCPQPLRIGGDRARDR